MWSIPLEDDEWQCKPPKFQLVTENRTEDVCQANRCGATVFLHLNSSKLILKMFTELEGHPIQENSEDTEPPKCNNKRFANPKYFDWLKCPQELICSLLSISFH
jgi:hypothetical protein